MVIPTSKNGLVAKAVTSPGVAAYLYDFDIDGYDLKKNHKDWLDLSVVSHVKKSPVVWQAFLDGTASYTGEFKHNVALSAQRVEQVKNYLEAKFAGQSFDIQTSAFGYTSAMASGKKYGKEDERDRAVVVVVQEKSKPKPPPPPPPQIAIPLPKLPSLSVDDYFMIRMLGGASIGGDFGGGDELGFEIWAQNLKKSAFYGYSGRALGFSLAPVSETLEGIHWTEFWTRKEEGGTLIDAPVYLDAFEGLARFNTIGSPLDSVNFLYIDGLGGKTVTRPEPVLIETGTTIGVGASVSLGTLTWSPRQIFTRTQAGPTPF